MGLLAHLGQGPAIPDRDGDSAESGRGGEQEAGAPEIPVFRGGRSPSRCLIYGDRFGSKWRQFTKGHGDLRAKITKLDPGETYFLKARLWWRRAKLGPQKIQESVFKKFENAFFYEI
jgi:hypothetical protein